VVHGRRDPICPLQWATEMARRLLQGRLVEIPAVAHTLVYTAPEQLARITRQFFAETCRPRAVRRSTGRAAPSADISAQGRRNEPRQ
jgi:TAP-like protein